MQTSGMESVTDSLQICNLFKFYTDALIIIQTYTDMVELMVHIAISSPAFLRILLTMILIFNSPVIFSFWKKEKEKEEAKCHEFVTSRIDNFQ